MRGNPLPLQSLVPFPSLDLVHLAGERFIAPFMLANISYSVISVACVESCDQLGDQVRMFTCFLHSRQAGTGSLPLPRSRQRSIAVQQQTLLLGLPLHIALRLLLQQPQVQLAEGVGAQTSGVEGRVIAHDGDGIQLLGDAVEDGVGVNAFGPQGLEE